MSNIDILFRGLTVPLHDMLVLEWGHRTAVQACGDLLAQLGADVAASAPVRGSDAPFSRCKRFLPADEAAWREELARANVVLVSSDRKDELPLPLSRRSDLIVCDIKVGAGGHGNWTDPLLQAAAGIANITGPDDGAPTICGAPIIELQAAIFAASSIVAAWPQRKLGIEQHVELSLIDCGLNGLSSFLPFTFAGQPVRRSGNSHPMAVPWNSYRAKDGWILLCSATDDHWVRLCQVMERPDVQDGDLATLPGRIQHRAYVDAIVQQWAQTRSVKECIDALGAAGLAAGPILAVDELKNEANLLHRGSIFAEGEPLPRSFVKCAFGASPPTTESRTAASRKIIAGPPLAGIRVLEIGQYTTAPLAAKQLALLGAEVVKIEGPGGEASRSWAPHQRGQGYFYTLNNANKRSCEIDLRTDAGRESFAQLVQNADVLIENLKPGSLARRGFGAAVLQSLNPRLVYCAISGFGQVSAYPGRPAFDTVVQAMSGLMDVTKVNGVPTKVGISVADIAGGIAGLLAVLAGLEQRRQTGVGTMIDLAMHDVATWMTQTAWHGTVPPSYSVLRCKDGHVVAACSALDEIITLREGQAIDRVQAIAKLADAGIMAAAVRTLEEIAADPQIVGGGAITIVESANGDKWPLFNPPYRFSSFEPLPLAPIGALGEANAEMVEGIAGAHS